MSISFEFGMSFCPASPLGLVGHRIFGFAHRLLLVLSSNSPMAEREGFEPSRPFWGLHDFESCAFDHSATSP